jgi:hypothetical protein
MSEAKDETCLCCDGTGRVAVVALRPEVEAALDEQDRRSAELQVHRGKAVELLAFILQSAEDGASMHDVDPGDFEETARAWLAAERKLREVKP